MATLKDLTEYVRLIDVRNAEYGDAPQPAATPAQLETLTHQTRDLFGYELPDGYVKLLAVTDGFDFNGHKLYANQTRPLEGYDGNAEGFLEANDLWEDYAGNTGHHLIMFGETGDDLYLFDRHDQQFKVIDKVGGDAYEKFDTFEELVGRLLRDALGLFDEAEEQ